MITQAVLPKGVSKEKFAKAIEEYKAIVGPDNVFVDLEELVPYFKTMMPVDDARHQASGAISATSVEQIQRILAVCNKYKIPVWTVSTGRNFGYGSAAPATPGQMILDLRRMNKIIDVDPDLCTALVEPGVTYQELRDYIEERKIPVFVSHPAPGPIVGPVGNSLDRGVGYNRLGQNCSAICGMEVVLANGDVIRTGMGGVKGTDTWQAYQQGFGPSPDGLFQQSNFGVVTKMGLWLQPKPETYKMFIVAIGSEKDLAKAVDIQRKLRLQMVIENGILGVSPLFAPAMVIPRNKIFEGKGALPDEVVAKIAQDFKVPPVTFMCNLYGTQAQVDVNFRIVEEAFKGVGQVITTENNVPHDSPFWHWENMSTGKFDLHEFGTYNWRGGGGSVWFSPVVPAKGEEVAKSVQLNKKIMQKHGFDYLAGFVFQPRFAEHVMELQFDRTDPDQLKSAYACFDELLTANAEAGHAPYRVNTAFMNKTAEIYGPEARKLNARLKQMFDPNGILAPGKSGIG